MSYSNAIMTSPVLDASRATPSPADASSLAAAAASGRLDEVERGLSQLSAPSRRWMDGFLGVMTGAVNRDGLKARYAAWQRAHASGDVTAQLRTLGELRAAFERFQDHCSVDDHIVAQRAYADIDAALARLRQHLTGRQA